MSDDENTLFAGSSPASGANFAEENGKIASTDTLLTQPKAENTETEENVKWPKRLKHRNRVLAVIYRKSKHYPLYRLAWRVKGQRRMKAFDTYSEAKRAGDVLIKELAKGSTVTALTPGQASDALAALERLQTFHQNTGRRVSILSAVAEWANAAEKLSGRTVPEAIEGYLTTVASVKRKDVAQAVEDFIAAEEPKTKASEGQRPQLSPKYAYNRGIMLRRFAAAFPGHAVCDLTKDHLDKFLSGLAAVKSKSNRKPVASAKARNHHRQAVRGFLQWAVRKDYLAVGHRLFEADKMRPENGNTSEIEFYSPVEFKALLEAASGPMRAMVAIGGLAGLRTAELLRLTWEDTRRVEGHIEVTSGKAKTRQRRLVEIPASLTQWLAPFAESTGKIWTGYENLFHKEFVALCERADYETKGRKLKVTRKPNGLRHAFCTFHFAVHGNENLTAMQAGNSPAMVHQHYKGLATKKEAEAWFAVTPVEPANVIPLVRGQQMDR